MRNHHHHRHIQMATRSDGDDLGGGRGRGRGFGGESSARGEGRIFGHGGLRFVLLHLIGEKPSHGYELIKLIEERLGGHYSPSPGTVYPTLTLLEELTLLTVDLADEGGRKLYRITDAGRDYLEENRVIVDKLLQRLNGGIDGAGPRGGRPPQVRRAIENLKLAMRMRLSGEELTTEQANAFAAVLDRAAQQLEQI